VDDSEPPQGVVTVNFLGTSYPTAEQQHELMKQLGDDLEARTYRFMLWIDRELTSEETSALFAQFAARDGIGVHTSPSGTIVYVYREAGTPEEAAATVIMKTKKAFALTEDADPDAETP
jgi:hypothetical protein